MSAIAGRCRLGRGCGEAFPLAKRLEHRVVIETKEQVVILIELALEWDVHELPWE
jgi:hypothetical protein